MKKVLVVGTNNSCISVMIAALMKHISFNRIDVQSAGIRPKKVNPYVKKVLMEIGIDISKEKPNSINEFIHIKWDIIITTTDEAREKAKTILIGNTRIHRAFEDPMKVKGEIERMNAFRLLRDEINEWLNEFIARHRLIPS
ncbi:MAG: arsenate reductase ArsC [Calditrichaeota bacterium]|nr:arsenate reductase ArsC [Calditrichota bacterium]